MKKWGQLSNNRFCCYGDACDGGDADFVIYLFPVTAVTFFEKVGAVSINEFPVFQKIPLVGTHIVLEAADLGLGSCFVGRFKEKDVKDALSLPENIRVRLLIPVGYPAENCVPNPRHTDYRPTNETVEII